MKDLYFLRLINIFAFAFAISNTLFLHTDNIIVNSFIYLWCIALTFISYIFKEKHKKLYLSPILIIYLPLFFINSTSDVVIFLIMLLISIVLIIKDNYSNTYTISKDFFTGQILIVFLLGVASRIFDGNLNRYSTATIPYLLIFILSGILFAKNYRNRQINKKAKKRLSNFLLISIMLILTFILSIKSTRDFLFSPIKKLFYFVAKIIYELFMFLNLFPDKKFGNPGKPRFDDSIGIIGKHAINDEVPETVPNTILSYVLVCIVFVLLLLLIIKIIKHIKKRGFLTYKEEEYIQTSEFILNRKKNKNNFIKNISSKFTPKNNGNKIRFYYSKFIKICIDENISIKESDTTYDINKKSKSVFNFTPINNMRNIYIKVRYSDSKVDDATVSAFINNYKKIKP